LQLYKSDASAPMLGGYPKIRKGSPNTSTEEKV
jgi:hypothetical protein